ncbi:MAG: hypothetical protein WCZ23_03480 [Rhodospirillaceae bacterium]
MNDTPLFLDRHPYFTDGVLWSADGWYFDESGHMIRCRGWSRVRRSCDAWTVSSELRLDLFEPDPIALRCVLTLDAPDSSAREAFWTAENPALGEFSGRFTAVADTLISVGFSEDGLYQSTEMFILGEDGEYYARGTLARESETVAAWAVTLTAEDPADEA